jgi:hypothetical protein
MWFQRRRKVEVATHNRTAKVLDSATWTVVAHLDDRAYPGVVIQGDCLKAMKDATDRIVARARQIKDDDSSGMPDSCKQSCTRSSMTTTRPASGISEVVFERCIESVGIASQP